MSIFHLSARLSGKGSWAAVILLASAVLSLPLLLPDDRPPAAGLARAQAQEDPGAPQEPPPPFDPGSPFPPMDPADMPPDDQPPVYRPADDEPANPDRPRDGAPGDGRPGRRGGDREERPDSPRGPRDADRPPVQPAQPAPAPGGNAGESPDDQPPVGPPEGAVPLEKIPPEERARRNAIGFRYVVQKNQEVDVELLLKELSFRTGIPVFPERAVKGTTIKFIADATLNYQLLLAVLELNDVALVFDERNGEPIIKAYIERNVQNKEGGTPTPVLGAADELPTDPQFVTQIVTIQYADPNAIFATLRQLVSRSFGKTGQIFYVRGPEAMIIRDLAPAVEYYSEIIKALDIKGPDLTIKVYKLRYAMAEQVANLATQLLQAAAQRGQAAGQVVSPGAQPKVIADARTNKIIVFAMPRDIEEFEKMIAELDVEVMTTPGDFHIRQLKNTSSKDMAGVLNELLQAANQARQQQGQAQQQIPSRVVAEEQTNSLLIQAQPAEFQHILRLVEALDIRRPQVLIEAHIFEIAEGDQYKIGVDLAAVDPLPSTATNDSLRGGAITSYGHSSFKIDGTTDPNSPDQSIVSIVRTPNLSTGLTLLMFKGGFDKIPLILNALNGTQYTNILAQPFALTNDNKAATFTDSDQIPVLTSTQGISGSPLGLTTTGQTQNADTSLKITPHISASDYLRLEIDLKIEDFKAGAQANEAGSRPKISRQYTGEVTVPDNRYIVIGGMSRINERRTVSGIPFIGNVLEYIPIVKWLVSSRSVDTAKTHVFIFVRPHILRDEAFETAGELTRYWQSQAESLTKHKFAPSPLREDARRQNVKHRIRELFREMLPNPYER